MMKRFLFTAAIAAASGPALAQYNCPNVNCQPGPTGRQVNISGATLYVTCSPCWECFKVLANCGIKRICYGEFYRNERVLEAAAQIGIEMTDLSSGTGVCGQES